MRQKSLLLATLAGFCLVVTAGCPATGEFTGRIFVTNSTAIEWRSAALALLVESSHARLVELGNLKPGEVRMIDPRGGKPAILNTFPNLQLVYIDESGGERSWTVPFGSRLMDSSDDDYAIEVGTDGLHYGIISPQDFYRERDRWVLTHLIALLAGMILIQMLKGRGRPHTSKRPEELL